MGAYLNKPEKKKITEMKENHRFICVSTEMQGWRNHMEDDHFMELDINDDHVSVFGVFDGHGGYDVAKFCGKYFCDYLKKNSFFTNKDYKNALEDTFLKIDSILSEPKGQEELKKIRREVNFDMEEDDLENDEEINSGCTANVILIVQNKIYCANAGDSRSVICKNGQAIELSEDHKPENDIEFNRICKAGGEVVNGRVDGTLNLSRAIGDFEFKRNPDLSQKEQKITSFPDIKEYTLTGNESFILMGCDGIWEKKSNQENIDLVNKMIYTDKADVQEAIEALLEENIAKSTDGIESF